MIIGDQVEAFDDVELGRDIKTEFKNKYMHLRENIRMLDWRLNDEKYADDHSEIRDKLNTLLLNNKDLISDFCKKLFPIHSKNRYILCRSLIKNEKLTQLISLFDRGLLTGYKMIEGSTKIKSTIGFWDDDFKTVKHLFAKKIRPPCDYMHDVYFRVKDLQLRGFIKAEIIDKPAIDADFIKIIKLDMEAIVKAAKANFMARKAEDAHVAAITCIKENPVSIINPKHISIEIFKNRPGSNNQINRTLRNRLYKAISVEMGYKKPTNDLLKDLLTAEKSTL